MSVIFEKLEPLYVKDFATALFEESFPPANKAAVCVPALAAILTDAGALPISVQLEPSYSIPSATTGSPPPTANPAVCVPATVM